MRIATFNCNSVRSRIPIITKWLDENKPDMLALQEIKVVTEDFPHEPFNEIGYVCSVQGQKRYAGVAILSKKKPDRMIPGFNDGDETEFPRLMTCKFGPVWLINTYVPQGRDIEHEQFQYKLAWFRRFKKFMQDNFTKRQKVVWVGDFNVAPDPIDVHDSKRIMGHVDHNPQVTEALENVREWGFFDLFRKFHPDEPGHYTYFDYRVITALDRNTGWRVDHIYTTNSLAGKSTDCFIDRKPRAMEKPSDHTFLVADFDL